MHEEKITGQRLNIEEWTNTEILEAVKGEVEQQGLSEEPEGTPGSFLDVVELSEDDWPVPPEVWAVRTVGPREIASADPVFFVKPA